MPRWLPRVLRWGALVYLLSGPVAAQEADSVTRDAARSLGLSGVDAYQAGDYDVASSRLEKAYALIPLSATLARPAKCQPRPSSGTSRTAAPSTTACSRSCSR